MARPLTSVTLSDERRVDIDDSDADAADAPVAFWHGGSPHTGALLEPLLALAREHGIRMITVARPGYAASDPVPERSIALAAADTLQIADLLGIERFAVLGYSGGGPHALASAALAPARVAAVALFASPAPFADAPDWWDGMASDAALRAALMGREERLRFAETEEFDPAIFVDTDWNALRGEWAALGEDAGAADDAPGPGLPDDDLALVRPWGVDLAAVSAPVLLVHGWRDRIIPPAHATLLAEALPDPTLWWQEDAGHVAVLRALPDALGWIVWA